MTFKLNTLYNADCLPAMRKMPDKAFDLAIVDPPYGGGATRHNADALPSMPKIKASRTGGTWAAKYSKPSQESTWENKPRSRLGGLFDRYDIPSNENTGDIRHWDVAPPQEYFEELFRVSKNQIIWGGNYFDLPPTRCFVVWRKLTISEKFTMAMAEYAWTSFDANAFVIECAPQGTPQDPRFHPTQKPLKLYRELLARYASKGDKILDTHAGSASSLIACIEHGYDFVGYEIDPTYHAKAKERIDTCLAQGRLAL